MPHWGCCCFGSDGAYKDVPGRARLLVEMTALAEYEPKYINDAALGKP